MITALGGGVRHKDCPFTQQGAWAGHRVAAGLAGVAEDGAEFFQAGIDASAFFLENGDGSRQEAEVGKFGPGTEVGVVAEDGIAEIGEVAGLSIVHKN